MTPPKNPADPESPPDPPEAGTGTHSTLLPVEHLDLDWVFQGSQGLRAGWSVLLFILLGGFASVPGLFSYVVGTVFYLLHLVGKGDEFTAPAVIFGELSLLLTVVGAAAMVALVELRPLLAFNLTGPRRALHFFSGFAAGFAALSVLVGALVCGGWMHFGPVALTGAAVFKFGVLWAVAFLLVGCYEEGVFRCFLQFTLTRGINFWWALASVGAVCLAVFVSPKSNGPAGVYAAAALGLLPCLILHKRAAARSGFWQAAWVTSTLFASIHTANNGESWIGIFAAALIGFVFCVSVRVTGTAWWAIGCHAAWDWAETFFYGTADSGNVATGHYLTTNPVGNVLWSGGADGPEGSLLVLGAILLLLAALIAMHGRKKLAAPPSPLSF
jgi:membrane protease YdiL (CAAX protease family)